MIQIGNISDSPQECHDESSLNKLKPKTFSRIKAQDILSCQDGYRLESLHSNNVAENSCEALLTYSRSLMKTKKMIVEEGGESVPLKTLNLLVVLSANASSCSIFYCSVSWLSLLWCYHRNDMNIVSPSRPIARATVSSRRWKRWQV